VRLIDRLRNRKGDERGFTLLLTAIVLPVLVIFAGLGMGGAIVRSTADETQRSAELSAVAAAVSLPNLGRPDVTGKPTVPSAFPTDLPPSLANPPASPCNAAGTAYTPGSPYYQIDQTNDCVDEAIAHNLHVGPISSLDNLFGTWHAGCDVAQAQYDQGRAHMSRTFALQAAGTPKTPTCPSSSTGQYINGHPERVYIRPEMESTGAYQLQQCLVQGVNCFNSPTTAANDQLQAMGSAFTTVMSNVPGRVVPSAPNAPTCLINPTAATCALSQAELAKTLSDAGVPNADTVASAVASTYPTQISDVAGAAYARAATGLDDAQHDYGPIAQQTSQITQIAASLFGTTSGGMCGIALGRSGQTLCAPGVNLASMLPSTLSPRVRAIITHAINVPLAPSFDNFLHEGDLAFAEQALARRTFKNAVVLPTIPKQLVAPTASGVNTCFTGAAAADAASALGLSWTLNGLSSTLTAGAGAGAGASVDNCGNAQLDNTTVDPTSCDNPALPLSDAQRSVDCTVTSDLSGVIDTVNSAPSTTQKALVSAAAGLNEQANRAINTVVAQELNAEDPGHTYSADDCRTTDKTTGNPQAPASWCVGVDSSQQIRDLQDFYGAPPDGTGPTYGDVLASVADTNQPLAVMGLSSTVDLCAPNVAGSISSNVCTAINSALAASLGRNLTTAETVKSLPMVIPALDVVPVLVHRDATKRSGYRFEVVPNTSSTPGLYRAVLLDPDEAFPLCTTPSSGAPPRVTSCNSQPTVLSTPPLPTTTIVTLPPVTTTTTILLPPVTTTTTIVVPPVTTSSTSSTTSTTFKLGFP
jgi:hypothetical protein